MKSVKRKVEREKRQAVSGKWKGTLQKNYSFAAKEKHKFAIKKFSFEM